MKSKVIAKMNIRWKSVVVFMFQFIYFCHGKSKSRLKQSDIFPKIVGGEVTKISKFPHLALFTNMYGSCGASILTTRCVLTAAHCFDFNLDARYMYVETGKRGGFHSPGDQYFVKQYLLHENYNKTVIFENDIALLWTETPIKLKKHVQKAILVGSDPFKKKLKKKAFIVTGWGWTTYHEGEEGHEATKGLMMARLSYVPMNECMRLHNRTFSKDMFCLYGDGKRDSCRGDSGGGVMWKGMVVGIVSHGDGCAQKHLPSIYANVWYFRDWIKNSMMRLTRDHCDNNTG